jgi:hypothetical protein
MSLFLIYVELGPLKSFTMPPHPLVLQPVDVHNQGRSGPVKRGWAITDGVASDGFLRYGNRAADRQGETLRAELFAFVSKRISDGARPALCFVFVHLRDPLIFQRPN